MGNQINSNTQTNINIEDKHFIFPGYSNKLPNINTDIQNNKIQTDKILDLEDITISKVVEAKLNKTDTNNNFLFLEDYIQYLTQNLKPKKFRIKDFEEITEFVMKYSPNPLEYLLECYHRSIDIIEIKSRQDFDDKYKEIHRILAYYIGTILTEPEILEIKIDINTRYNTFKKYLKSCNIDELGFILYDIEAEIGDNEKAIKLFFGLYFQYIYEENKDKFRSFLASDSHEVLSKNMSILKTIFINFPYTISLFIEL